MADSRTFDAVVIGSGLGGLTAGALLAKAGLGVCVLERNFSVGGAASVYRAGALTVESSLHQTSDPRNPRDVKRWILSELGILDEIEWVPTGPLYVARGGPLGEAFALPKGFGTAKKALVERFPERPAQIGSFLDSIDDIHDSLWNLSRAREDRSLSKFVKGVAELGPAVDDWQSSLDDVFTREFENCEALKCALAANLAYYGDDPKRMWFIFYALAQGGYIASGGAYIKGGSRQLSLKLARVIMKAGGIVRLGREARAIETDADGKAIAVTHAARREGTDEERIGARLVFANCAPSVATALLPEKARARMEKAFGARPVSTSLFCAHLGLRAKPATVGLTDYSTVVLPQWMKRLDQYGESAALLGDDPKGRLPAYGIANFSAVDSGLWDEPPHLVSVAGLDRIGNWSGLTQEQAKERRARWLDAIIEALERDYPGFAGLVTEKSLLNARSMQSYLNTPEGAVYGFAPLPPQEPIFAGFPRTPATPVPSLYLASAFAGEHGFNGAMLSGAEAARMAMETMGADRSEK